MPHSQALFGIALITIIAARLVEWLLLVRTFSLQPAAAAAGPAQSEASDLPSPEQTCTGVAATASHGDKLRGTLLMLAWVGALTPPLLIATGICLRLYQE